jgi:hypothetical protein
MKYLKIFIIFSLIYCLFTCSPVNVKTDWDYDADFSMYNTYRWVPAKVKQKNPRARMRNPLMEKRIKAAMDAELSVKGLRRLESGRPDILVTYHLGARDKINVTNYNYGYWRRGYRGHAVQVHKYKEGTLVIDIIDGKRKQLVWRGWGTQVIERSENPEEKIKNAVKKILEQYPPGNN